MRSNLWAWGLVAVCLTWAASVQGAGSPAQSCEAAKLKATGKNAACRLTEVAKAAVGGTADLTKCGTKLTVAFGKAETKAGPGVCPTNGDAASIDTRVSAALSGLDTTLSGARFVDNGDGTVTDSQTGLQWEKKHTGGGPTDPHDLNNSYSWTANLDATIPDGTIFTDFLYRLNNCVSSDGTTVTGGFAGHCDWRLPTIAELETILLAPSPCGTNPCVDPIFGITTGHVFYSSTESAGNSLLAWAVLINNGQAFEDYKDDPDNAVAVRKGP